MAFESGPLEAESIDLGVVAALDSSPALPSSCFLRRINEAKASIGRKPGQQKHENNNKHKHTPAETF